MRLYSNEDGADILNGDCREVMATLPADRFHAVICDPPYELGFMNRGWDKSGVSYDPATWEAALRVLKPGGWLLAFGGTRTFHRLGVAIEDAGFDYRDTLSWLYGSGFPKSLDVSKALDKLAGAEREVVGSKKISPTRPETGTFNDDNYEWKEEVAITVPSTPEAAEWQGWGTALKPAWEPIIMARKPFKGTVAANVLEHGTGGLNIDGCRIEGVVENRGGWANDGYERPRTKETFMQGTRRSTGLAPVLGRWPANVVLDEEAAAMVDEASGDRRGMSSGGQVRSDSGGASRFYYTAKASRAERERGLEDMEPVRRSDGRAKDIENPRLRTNARKNHHPTVKPVALMRWLVRLVTPPGGVVLDPFMGSGSTGVAVREEGFKFVGVDLDAHYCEIAKRRIAASTPPDGATENWS